MGQLNTILPSAVSIGSLCSMRPPTLLFEKFGTYQSSAMVPCFRTKSLMDSSLLLYSSTVGSVLILCFLGFAICPLCHRSCLHACVVGAHFHICFPYLLFSFLRSLLVIVSLSRSPFLAIFFRSFLFAVSRVSFFEWLVYLALPGEVSMLIPGLLFIVS